MKERKASLKSIFQRRPAKVVNVIDLTRIHAFFSECGNLKDDEIVNINPAVILRDARIPLLQNRHCPSMPSMHMACRLWHTVSVYGCSIA